MAENFNNREYWEYFKKLEQFNNTKNEPQEKQITQFEVVAKAHRPVRKRRFKRTFVALALVVVLIFVGAVTVGKPYKKADESEEDFTTVEKTEEKEEKIKISFSFSEETPDITAENDAQSAIIVDRTSNTVVAAREPNQKMYPASITKVMTLLVAAENITDYNDTFTMTYDITDPLYVMEASVAGFLNGESITITDLIYGTILPSGADAATALAIKTAGSEAEFVKLMNKKVKELGLKNTNFTNVTGLHDEKNYSTAYDLAVIFEAALKNELCRKVLSTYQYTTTHTPQHPEGILLSATLFSYMYGNEPGTATILGGKTGFVNESGYCIASYGSANESQNEYIVITLGNSSRWPAFYGQIDLYKNFIK